MCSSEPGTQRRRDDERRRRGEVAGHLDRAQLEPLGGPHRHARVGAAVTVRSGRLEQPLGVVARRRRLDDGRLAVGVRGRRAASRTSPARSRPAGRSRSHGAGVPSIRIGRCPSVGLDAGAHAAERLGDPRPSAARESDSSPVSSKRLAGWPARIPDSSRTSVPALRAVDRPCRAPTSPRRPFPNTRSVSAPARRRRPRASARPRSSPRCRPDRPKPRDPRLAVADRTDQDRAVRDRLVAGDGEMPDEPRHRLDSPDSGCRVISSITGAATTP